VATDPEALPDALGERGLAGAEPAVEQHEVPRAEQPGEGLPEPAGGLGAGERQVHGSSTWTRGTRGPTWVVIV